jgi:hypothetical protein
VAQVQSVQPELLFSVRYELNLVAGFPTRRPGFEPESIHVGFLVEKVALAQAFSEYFDFWCQFSFH